MKTKFNGILTLLLALVVQISFAQEKTVSGTIADETGPIIGVSVLVQGTNTSTDSDFNGKYTIKAKKGDVLIFNYIGMKTVKKTVGTANTINVEMVIDESNILDEVVLVGYGNSTKQSFTGSVKVVKAAELEKKSVANISQALNGEVSGVNVINTSGQPGTTATIRIRGFGSVNGNRAPLYVVDGTPFAGTINSINPSDVETTTILKDATATAIYGSRGANGVVLITTKTGKSGKGVIEVDHKTSVNFRSDTDYDVITSPNEYIGLAWQAIGNTNTSTTLTNAEYANANLFGSSGISELYNYFTTNDVSQIINQATGQVNPGTSTKYTPENWRDYTYQSSIRTEANLKMSGGNENTKYFTSFGFLDDVGYIKNSGYKRYSTRLNISHKPKKWLTAKSNIAYTYGKTTSNGQGSSSNSVFWFVNSMPSIFPLFLRDENGNLVPDTKYGGNQYDYGVTGRNFGLGTNAVGDAKYNLDENERYSFNGNFSIELNLFEGLTFESKYGIQHYSYTGNDYTNPFYGAQAGSNGSLSQLKASNLSQNMLNMFRYSKDFGKNTISALLAHETNQNVYEQSTIDRNTIVNLYNGLTSASNYINTTIPSAGYVSESTLESLISQFNYSYDSKYFFTASLRRDGSSRFATDKWGTFGSVGASWIASKESFTNNIDFINFLKFKTSYGLVGDQAGVGTFSGQNTYSASNLGGNISLSVNGIQNPNLTWETSKMFQIGTEFTLFNNIIDGSLDYYVKNTEDLIFDRRIGTSIGDALITTNDGTLRNSGIEFDFTGHIVNNQNFNLDLSINGEMLSNELTLMPIEPSTGLPKVLDVSESSFGRSKGKSLYDFYLREWAGVDSENGNALWNVYYHDSNSNGLLDTGESIGSLTEYQAENPGNEISKTTTNTYADATEKYIGKSVIPKIRGAFRLNAKVYGFDISTQFAYSLGGYAYDGNYGGLMSNAQIGSSNYHVDIKNAWQQAGDITDVPRLQSGVNTQVNSLSSRFVTSSDYLALNNLRIGYNLPKRMLAKTDISNINLWISGDNLYLKTARKGFDPRSSQTGASSTYTYAPLSTLTAGVRVKF